MGQRAQYINESREERTRMAMVAERASTMRACWTIEARMKVMVPAANPGSVSA